jgi:hypothetical protein
MNMLEAMRDTVLLMDNNLDSASDVHKYVISAMNADLQPPHIRDMLSVMESGINPQDTEAGFSDGKMGRWLGWAQAAVVAMNLASLDDMKNINRKWAGTST